MSVLFQKREFIAITFTCDRVFSQQAMLTANTRGNAMHQHVARQRKPLELIHSVPFFLQANDQTCLDPTLKANRTVKKIYMLIIKEEIQL